MPSASETLAPPRDDGSAEPALAPGLDPVTFEVIRHRLWAINDDQGRMAARLSGSPTVYDAYDFNAGLMTADGRGLFTGVYIMHHGSTLDEFVRRVLAEWPTDDLRDGDMFYTNDPWWGALHANDGILAMPIFWRGRLVAWSGIVMHDSDVGSPIPGSFVVGARDRFGEAPLFPAVRIVEGYRLRHDIERLRLRNSRLPEATSLNMRARMAGLRSAGEQVRALVDRYGLEAFEAAEEGILDYVERVLRRRLREIPDGTWYAEGYHDHDGVEPGLYRLCCRVTKLADRLVFDMTGTAPQAPGPVNCARPAMEGAVIGVVLTLCCFDLPWSVGAVRKVVEIRSVEGTINNATGAAAVSMASIMATLSTQDVVSSALSKLLLASDRYRSEAQATWTPGICGGRLIATDRAGELTMSRTPDSFGGGGGARSFTDGIDSGGILHSMASRISNAEVTEARGAVLQLWRREICDSGGPGRFRGGVSIEFATMAHKAAGGPGRPPLFNVTASGVALPAGFGLAGGLPGAAASNVVYRQTALRQRFAAGELPTEPERFAAAAMDVLAAKAHTVLGDDDVCVSVVGAGAGFGDPLRRDLALVERDVRLGLVSRQAADSIYGVVVGDAGADPAASAARRQAIQADRLRSGHPFAPAATTEVTETGVVLGRLADTVEVVAGRAGRALRCSLCHRRLGGYGDEAKQGAVVLELPLTAASPLNRRCDADTFVLRQFCCPGCGTSIAVDVQRRGEPVRDDARLGRTVLSGLTKV